MKAQGLVVAAGLSALLACSSSNGGTGDQFPQPDAQASESDAGANPNDSSLGGGGQDQFVGPGQDAGNMGGASCATASLALCNKVNTCWPDQVTQYYGDVATCATRVALTCADEIAAPGTGWTSTIETSCVNALVAGTCADYFDGVLPSACTANGTIAAGGACGESVECGAGFSCRKTATAFCGTCVASVAAGGSCAEANCAAGLQCNSGVCQTFVALGGTCSANTPCAYPNYCANGTCVAGATLGTACSASNDICDATQNLYCDAMTQKCAAYTFVAAGQPCGALATGFTDCTGGGFCAGTSATVKTGMCVAPAMEGAACNATTGPTCLRPAYCNAGTCTLPDSSTCR